MGFAFIANSKTKNKQMRIYKLKVYHIGSCDVDIFLVIASSEKEAVEKLKSKGYYPEGGVEELYWEDGIHLLRNY